jgi:hypothetical protein
VPDGAQLERRMGDMVLGRMNSGGSACHIGFKYFSFFVLLSRIHKKIIENSKKYIW